MVDGRHLGIYQITLLGGLNVLVIGIFLITTWMLIIFLQRLVALYLEYKRQIDIMMNDEETSSADC